jgi:hypothetical protein
VALAASLAASCAGPPEVDYQPRIEEAKQGLADDPAIQAREAEVEAALAHEQGEAVVDEIEIRVGEEFVNEHRVRVSARIPVKSPGELRTRQEVLRANTEVAVARLEQASLEWSGEWQRSGVIDELSATRFELERRLKLATREPVRPPQVEVVIPVLPEIEARPLRLVRALPLLRETVRSHHPSVTVRRATAERYRALSNRANSQAKPWLKFVDVSYEHESGGGGANGGGARLAFELPLGARERASAGRYQALVRREQSEEQLLVDEQVQSGLQALGELADFESRTEQWQELQQLAGDAEGIAERWWRDRLARPSQVASLLDEAFAARVAVLEARERAAIAGCTLLAMTGVPPEEWPRE